MRCGYEIFVFLNFFGVDMIDSHCHIGSLLKHVSLEVVKSRAVLAGVARIVSCSCSEEDWSLHSDVLGSDDMFVSNFGIHPWWSHVSRKEGWEDEMRSLLEKHPHAGVGEIGLDKPRVKRGIPFGVQLDIFRKQMRIAMELDRTVTVHCVQAFGQLLGELTGMRPEIPIVMHSYSGSCEFVRQVEKIAKNCFFSVSARSPSEEVVKAIPLDRLLIETDSPDQKGEEAKFPEPLPTCNDCSQLGLVVLRVSRATGVCVDEIVRITSENARRAFRMSGG